MEYKVLYRKYRPNNFDELVGQNHIKSILKNSIIDNKIAHAYIFTGPRGTGKTSTAKIFARTLNCNNPNNGIACGECENCTNSNVSTDIYEMDAASNNSVDNIREIIENIEIAPMYGKYKIFIIDEVHMLSNQAWNAFLKTLEEPPSNVIFILATTEIQKVPITVLSRCQRFDFQRLSSEDIVNNMVEICQKESIDYDIEALNGIAKISDGCMRDALSVLDQLSKISDKVTMDILSSNYGTVSESDMDILYSMILKNDTDGLIDILNIVKNKGVDIKNYINMLEDYMLNKAIQIKKSGVSNNAFLQLKNIICKLNELLFNLNSNSNGYLLLEIELLSFINDENNMISSREVNQIISREIISSNVIDLMNSNSTEIQYYKLCDDFIKIRINNSFCEASKTEKQKFVDSWDKFIKSGSLKSNVELDKIISKITPQVVSVTNTLFITKSESVKIIINAKLKLLEKKYNEYSKDKKDFIIVTSNEWKEILDDYNKNIKNEYKYQYIDDKEFINSSNDDSLAESIFGEENVTIE